MPGLVVPDLAENKCLLNPLSLTEAAPRKAAEPAESGAAHCQEQRLSGRLESASSRTGLILCCRDSTTSLGVVQ